jgi:CPA1 family monovalent cation:H+ antiporter
MGQPSATAETVWALFGLLLLALAILLLAKRSRLPFTVLLVLVGIGLTAFSDSLPAELHILDRLSISPDLILYVFLPTLIFESSYNLDARQLRHNLIPVLSLAVPGLLISTGLIGLILSWVTNIPLPAALLLGAILSATDPVAVIALFRQIGAPSRLTTLVEGESLFNDATSIVVAKILTAIMIAGMLSDHTLSNGVAAFFSLFLGGLAIGILLGFLTSQLIGWVESEPFVEIGLTTALAYLSFLIAEEIFHVSGVMSTVGAGLTLGTWGRIRISSSVRIYLEHFWELLAFIANALLFLLVGMKVDLGALVGALDLLVWVVLAMLLARAVIIFAMIPLIGRLPGSPPVGRAYQFVMFWGGLRGAIALAIVLSLPAFPQRELFVALVMGAVLFTLLIQGLSIEPLMRRLGLNVPPLADQIAFLERDLVSMKRALQRLPDLQKGGIFSSRIAHELTLQCNQEMANAKQAIRELRQKHMSSDQETGLLFLRALGEERAIYSEMYNRGHLSENSLRELLLVLNLQIDALRHSGAFQHVRSHRLRRSIEQLFYRLAENIPWLQPLAERMRMARLVRDYEQVWGHYQGSGHVLGCLQNLAKLEEIPEHTIAEVRQKYQAWHQLSAQQLQNVSEQFPEFTRQMQERFGKRLILLSELEITEQQAARGMLPRGIAENMEAELSRKIAALRGQITQKLGDDPRSLLRQVPLFGDLDAGQIDMLANLCQPLTLSAEAHLVREHSENTSLFLISRGVIRFYRQENRTRHDLGTLMAGEFFGERTLMESGIRDIAVVTLTPCRLFRLERKDLMRLLEQQPALRTALQKRNLSLRSRHQSLHADTQNHME